MDGTLIDRPLARIFLVLVCLYAPYAWIVLIDAPWDSYRWLWIKLWLLLPGGDDQETGTRTASIAVALPDSSSQSTSAPSIRTPP